MMFKFFFYTSTFKRISVMVGSFTTIKTVCKYIICPILILLSFSVESIPVSEVQIPNKLVHRSLMNDELISKVIDVNLPVKADNIITNKYGSKNSRGMRLSRLFASPINEIRTKAGKNEKTDESLDSQLIILCGFFIVVLMPMCAGNNR